METFHLIDIVPLAILEVSSMTKDKSIHDVSFTANISDLCNERKDKKRMSNITNFYAYV